MGSYFEDRMAEIKANPPVPRQRLMAGDLSRAPEPPKEIVGTKKGFIYFATAGDLDHVKIGFTTDLYSRVSTLSTGNREKMHIQESFYSYAEAEKVLHRHFAKDRLRGEWFNLTDDIEELWDDIMDYQGNHWMRADGSLVTDEFSDVFIPLDHLQKMLDHINKPWPPGLFADCFADCSPA